MRVNTRACFTLCFGVLLLLCLPSMVVAEESTNAEHGAPTPPEVFIEASPDATVKILVYADDAYLGMADRYPIVALENLGYSGQYTATDSPSTFYTLLTTGGPWDLVIVDHNNYFQLGSYWPDIEDYIKAGGKAIVTTFDVDGSHSVPTTLWATMGATYVSDMSAPENVYWWDPTHPILDGVPEFTSWTHGYFDDGDHVEPTADGEAIAGFSITPEAGKAAIIVRKDGKTILQSFLECENRADLDGDGVLDAVEIYMNKIEFIMRSPIGGEIQPVNKGTLITSLLNQLTTLYWLAPAIIAILSAAILLRKNIHK